MRPLTFAASLGGAAAVLFLGAPLGAQQPGMPMPMQPPPALVSSGHGETRIAPDRATVIVAVETRAATAAAAGAENARISKATMANLRAAGLTEKDQLTTAGYSVTPEYRYLPNETPKVTGYVARNTIRAEVRRIDDTGKVIDAALRGGATTIAGVQFTASKVDDARRSSIALAVGQACRDADAMARAAGVRLARPIELTTNTMVPGPRPMADFAMARAAKAEQEPTQLDPGEIIVTADVMARWGMLTGGQSPTQADAYSCQ